MTHKANRASPHAAASGRNCLSLAEAPHAALGISDDPDRRPELRRAPALNLLRSMPHAEDPKLLSDAAALGQAGIGVITAKAGLMGHNFHPYGQPEVGIDGAMELRDPTTRAMTGRILFVQSKAHRGPFDDETDTQFSFRVDRRDLDYWAEVSGPVVLVVSRPEDNEAWWLLVDEAFADPIAREARVTVFDKRRDRFAADSATALIEAFARDEARRTQAAQSLVRGPFAVLGLQDDLDRAVAAEAASDWAAAASEWAALAEAASGRLPPAFRWPLLERKAAAEREGQQRPAAVATYKELARSRLAEDDPSGDFDVQRALMNGARDDDFDFALLLTQSRAAEAGESIVDDYRHLHRHARTADERRSSGAGLVDVLVLYGHFDEAVRIADSVPLRRLDSPLKRQLLADRCDAASEVGLHVGDWDRLIASARRAGPLPYAWALQRHGSYLARRGEVLAARRHFMRAADIWSRVPGADDQAAEAVLSAEEAERLNGVPGERLPLGTRAALSMSRGAGNPAAVRADRLAFSGLAYLADGRFPDALKYLVSAVAVERRAGDLFGLRRMLLFAARALEAVDEYDQALLFWIRHGHEARAQAAARHLTFAQGRRLLRLEHAPAWERSASFAALVAWMPSMTAREVSQVIAPTLREAAAAPGFIAPQPSFYARQVLAAASELIARTHAPRAGSILRDEVINQGFSASEAAVGLMRLTRRGLIDGIPFFVEAILAGTDLPVTIAGHLADGDKALQRRMVDAAVAGNAAALSEVVRADLADDYPELVALCGARVQAALDSVGADPKHEHIGVSFVELGELGRGAPQTLRTKLSAMLIDGVFASHYDEQSKISALMAVAVLAPSLSRNAAARGLARLLPVAAGERPDSAPAVIRDHQNPKRARNVITREVGGTDLAEAAVQACGRLARLAAPASRELAVVIDESLRSDSEGLVSMALRELTMLPGLPVSSDVGLLENDSRPKVRRAARLLDEYRRTGELVEDDDE